MKILAVEDDDVSRYLLEKILSSERHDVVTARDGVEGMESFEGGGFDAVILDWMMPRMDGIELCKRIRARQESTGVPVYILMVTAKTQTDDMLDALMAGVDDFLAKPYNKDTLLSRVEVGRKLLAVRRGGDEGIGKGNKVVSQLVRDHETLRSIARILSFVRENIEGDLPKDLLKWCCSTAFLLNLDVHMAKENRYISTFLENLMGEQGDWFKVIADSSLSQMQEEHEELERHLTEFQGCLEVYLQRKMELLGAVTEAIKALGAEVRTLDSDKGLRKASNEVKELTDAYFAEKKKAVLPIKTLLNSYIALLNTHQEREEKFFFPFTQKYIGQDDERYLKREFEDIVKELGKARVSKEIEKVEQLICTIS